MNAVHCTTETPELYPLRVEVRGHTFRADLSTSLGGEDAAPGAHDFFDASLAICKAHTAMWFAKRNGIPLERVEVHVERNDGEERKGRYVLLVRLDFIGALSEQDRKRLHAAAEKCPVSKLMTTSEVVVETTARENER